MLKMFPRQIGFVVQVTSYSRCGILLFSCLALGTLLWVCKGSYLREVKVTPIKSKVIVYIRPAVLSALIYVS